MLQGLLQVRLGCTRCPARLPASLHVCCAPLSCAADVSLDTPMCLHERLQALRRARRECTSPCQPILTKRSAGAGHGRRAGYCADGCRTGRLGRQTSRAGGLGHSAQQRRLHLLCPWQVSHLPAQPLSSCSGLWMLQHDMLTPCLPCHTDSRETTASELQTQCYRGAGCEVLCTRAWRRWQRCMQRRPGCRLLIMAASAPWVRFLHRHSEQTRPDTCWV